ncbi:rRNA maturation RNase YbeY [uncultured Flavobacterium sp.]|uniref:rRNA maturation RNase YbeY n=1 Tax=uncultured Flavobacterium sp. TaxID=165435 RepID=UPI0030EBAD0B|tara:strand:+ start:15511 stop:15933 length:423 start_codon:yes stop_codon:yes gene_type:complete
MITFNYENDFLLEDESIYQDWISRIVQSENKSEGEINYIFCDDEYLININNEYLNHDTYTDIISFDYSVGDLIQGDIFISTERVAENAIEFNVPFENEIKRVLSHGVLHYCGYKDKTDNEALIMRQKEDEKIALFHVEQQ